MGYGINGFDRVVSNGDLCDGQNGAMTSDNFDKHQEAVFQMNIKATLDIETKQWAAYSDLDSEKAGFVCEKEGNKLTWFNYFSIKNDLISNTDSILKYHFFDEIFKIYGIVLMDIYCFKKNVTSLFVKRNLMFELKDIVKKREMEVKLHILIPMFR